MLNRDRLKGDHDIVGGIVKTNFLFGVLLVFCFSSLFAVELRTSFSLDPFTSVRGLSSRNSLYPSGAINLGIYEKNNLAEAFKLGFGTSVWLPHTPYDSDWEVTFSDLSAYGSCLFYPLLIMDKNNNKTPLSSFYVRGNVGYHHPLMWGNWVSGRMDYYSGGLYYGAGFGYDLSQNIFLEALYNCYYWGMNIYHYDGSGIIWEYNMGFDSFSIILGIKI